MAQLPLPPNPVKSRARTAEDINHSRLGGESESWIYFVDEAAHFAKFKNSHRRHMQVARTLERTGLTSNGNSAKRMQETVHLPDTLPWRLRLRDTLRRWSQIVVKQADDGTFRISKGMAGLFISALLTVAIMAGLGILWQRDEIVRLRTIQEIQDKTNADILSKVDQARNFATIADKNQARLEGKFDQFALQYGIRNAGKPNSRANEFDREQ